MILLHMLPACARPSTSALQAGTRSRLSRGKPAAWEARQHPGQQDVLLPTKQASTQRCLTVKSIATSSSKLVTNTPSRVCSSRMTAHSCQHPIQGNLGSCTPERVCIIELLPIQRPVPELPGGFILQARKPLLQHLVYCWLRRKWGSRNGLSPSCYLSRQLSLLLRCTCSHAVRKRCYAPLVLVAGGQLRMQFSMNPERSLFVVAVEWQS